MSILLIVLPAIRQKLLLLAVECDFHRHFLLSFDVFAPSKQELKQLGEQMLSRSACEKPHPFKRKEKQLCILCDVNR